MHVVLVDPEIPQNTGSIARTCAATATPLHLVGKVAFDISDKAVRRAGLDYWPYVTLARHDSWEMFLQAAKPLRLWYFSKFGEHLYYDVEYDCQDALVFGSETKGLGAEFLATVQQEQILRIPISCPAVRSLNLSNAVSIALYEARRQLRLDR